MHVHNVNTVGYIVVVYLNDVLTNEILKTANDVLTRCNVVFLCVYSLASVRGHSFQPLLERTYFASCKQKKNILMNRSLRE